MTPTNTTFEQKKQAWSLIDQACSMLNLTRDQHIQIEQSLQILKPLDDAKDNT